MSLGKTNLVNYCRFKNTFRLLGYFTWLKYSHLSSFSSRKTSSTIQSPGSYSAPTGVQASERVKSLEGCSNKSSPFCFGGVVMNERRVDAGCFLLMIVSIAFIINHSYIFSIRFSVILPHVLQKAPLIFSLRKL
jgi:hypothetical protein